MTTPPCPSLFPDPDPGLAHVISQARILSAAMWHEAEAAHAVANRLCILAGRADLLVWELQNLAADPDAIKRARIAATEHGIVK